MWGFLFGTLVLFLSKPTMAEQQVANFTYVPYVQGYDIALWRTLFGEPTTYNNKIDLTDAEIIHYATFMRGEVSFVLNVPTAPSAGDYRKVGLYNPSDGSYAYFDFNSTGTLAAACKRGDGASTSSNITWNTSWTAEDTVFKIRWEGGQIYFSIGGTPVAVLSESGSDVYSSARIPCVPMNLFLSNRMGDSLLIGLIVAKNVQGLYFVDAVTAGDIVEGLVFEGDVVTITESVSRSVTADQSTFDTGTVSESVTMSLTFEGISVVDTNTITEDVAVSVV